MLMECATCGGSGEVYYRGWRNDPEGDELVTCERCNGTGEIDDEGEEE